MDFKHNFEKCEILSPDSHSDCAKYHTFFEFSLGEPSFKKIKKV